MTTLLLRLAGPLQSWGDSSRFTRRHTRTEPTKSGVIGLLAAAQGRRRADPVEDLAAMRFGVRVDQRGRIERDFQTAILRRPGSRPESMPLSYRYYLGDAVFVAGVEGPDELISGLDEAVQAPAFPLYLGRRACPPMGRLSLGVSELPLIDALRELDWQAARWYRRQQGTTVHLELVADAAAGEGEESVRDVPVSFDSARREYGWREVARLPGVVVENPSGQPEPDFLAAYGGA